MRVAGLDIASKTGVVLLDGDEVLIAEPFQLKPAKSNQHRFARWNSYAKAMASFCATADLVAIEHYGFAFKGSGISLVEQGALIRAALWQQGIKFIEVPPLTLKKFVTGSGSASKEQMLVAVSTRWNFVAQDDNVADAYGLARLGQVMLTQRTPDELMSLREQYGDYLTNVTT